MYRDDVEEREDRDSMMSREGRELFVDSEDLGSLWFGAGVLAGLPARFLRLSCPFRHQGGGCGGAYKAGWAGGRWGQQRASSRR